MKRLALALTALTFLCGQTRADEAEKPNVLFLIVDDLTTSLSSQGWPGAKTPHLDRLAERGVRFERAYSQFSLCNPARASFLTEFQHDDRHPHLSPRPQRPQSALPIHRVEPRQGRRPALRSGQRPGSTPQPCRS